MATLQENGTFDALVDKYISKNEDAQLPELKTVENPKGALVMGTNCEFEPLSTWTRTAIPLASTWALLSTCAPRWAIP